ncbi:MAG: DUF2336 domain-containing protein [Alphaproteobacteria bacterium]|nr:DUF2336 domain-containing protein [Alphaproteobacteria bacterium]
MLNWVFGRKKAASEPAPNYEEARTIAEKGDEAARRKLAAINSLQPEFLYYFATDSSPDVRRAVANNDGTPIQADVLLSKDPDQFVRADLGRKIGRILPDLSTEHNQKLSDMVFEIVDTLSRDAMPEVRAIVADQVKQLGNVPPRIVERLAKDAEEIVCAPVLEFSPLLSDAFILDLIAGGLRGGALAAVGKRQALSAPVSEAVAGTLDEEGVAAFLANQTASMPPATLAALVDAAANQPAWHASLVGRRDLTRGLISKIGAFVSRALLDTLIEDNVLVDEAMAAELRAGVVARLEDDEDQLDSEPDEAEQEREEARARALHDKGELTGALMTKAAEANEREFLVHALALLTGVAGSVTRKVLTTKDAKLAVALAWKCGFPMDFAKALMVSVLGIEKHALAQAKGGDYPLSEDEMAWALEVVGIE